MSVLGHLEGDFFTWSLLTAPGMQRHAMSLCSRLFLAVDLEVGVGKNRCVTIATTHAEDSEV